MGVKVKKRLSDQVSIFTVELMGIWLASYWIEETRPDNIYNNNNIYSYSRITLQPKTGCPLKLSRVEPGQYLDGRPPGKTRLLLEEVLVRPAGGAHPAVWGS